MKNLLRGQYLDHSRYLRRERAVQFVLSVCIDRTNNYLGLCPHSNVSFSLVGFILMTFLFVSYLHLHFFRIGSLSNRGAGQKETKLNKNVKLPRTLTYFNGQREVAGIFRCTLIRNQCGCVRSLTVESIYKYIVIVYLFSLYCHLRLHANIKRSLLTLIDTGTTAR